MFLQVLDFLEIFLWQTIARGIGNIYYCSASLDDSFHYAGQILIVCTACILTVELYVIHKALGIFRGSNGALDNFFARTIEFILDMFVARADTGMDTLVLGIL